MHLESLSSLNLPKSRVRKLMAGNLETWNAFKKERKQYGAVVRQCVGQNNITHW